MKTTCSTTATSASSLFEKVCAGIFTCNRSVALYPKDHPMIRKCLEALQGALDRHAEELGVPFSVRTDEEGCPAAGKDGGAPPSRDGAELVRLLKRYFIKKLTIQAGASLEELFQVCFLLREEPGGGVQSPGDARISFAEWKHVHVEFFEPEDLPETADSDVAVLEAAAAPHLAGGVQSWLEGLPAEVREAARAAFRKPEILAQVMDLRQTIQKDLPSLQGPIQAEKVDFFGEILRLSGPRPSRVEDVESAARNVVSTLRAMTRFLVDNSGFLEGHSGGSSSCRDLGKLVKGLKEPGSANPAMRMEAGTIQSQRSRLDFLFQLIRGGAALPAAGASSQGPKAPPSPPAPGGAAGAPREGDKVDASSLKAQLEKISYDLSAFQRACRNVDAERRFLRIVQELLAADGPRQEIQGKWISIARSIASGLGGCSSLEQAIQLVMESFKDSDGSKAHDVVGEMLGARGDPAEVRRAIQGAILPQGGPEVAGQVLARILSVDERKGIEVLAALARGGTIAIRQTALSLLSAACTRLEPALAWVKADPSSLGRPEIRRVLGESEPRKVFEAFRTLFEESSSQESAAVLQETPAGATEMEPIILAAVEHGPPSVRKLGLLQLPRFRISSGFKLLTDIVVENNQLETPRMSDVEAALQALAEMKDPRAEAFLRKVACERRWFRYVWRCEIRQALGALSRGSGGIHAARR